MITSSAAIKARISLAIIVALCSCSLASAELPEWYVPPSDLRMDKIPLLELRHLQLFEIPAEDVAKWCAERLEDGDLPLAARVRCNQWRADALLVGGDHDAARKAYEEVLKHVPDDLYARCGYAATLARTGNRQQAVELLLKIVVERPAFAPAHSMLALLYLEQKAWKESAYHAGQAITHDAKDARGYLIRAVINMNGGRFQEALPDLDQAALLAPFDAVAPDQVYRLRGMALMMVGRHSEALTNFQMALHLQPESLEVMNNVCTTYRAMGQWVPALLAAERMAAIDEKAVSTLRSLMSCRTALWLDDGAIEASQAWVEAQPESAEARLKLAGLTALVGRHRDAKVMYQELLHEPPFEFAKRDYALLLSLSHEADVADPELALRLLESIAEQSRGPIWYACYAVALWKVGKQDEGAAVIEEQLQKQDQSENVTRFLKDIQDMMAKDEWSLDSLLRPNVALF